MYALWYFCFCLEDWKMEIFLTILAIVAGIAISFIIATMMSNVAVMKGHGKEVHAFAACFWLGIIGCIYVAALPDKIAQSQNQKIIELLERDTK